MLARSDGVFRYSSAPQRLWVNWVTNTLPTSTCPLLPASGSRSGRSGKHQPSNRPVRSTAAPIRVPSSLNDWSAQARPAVRGGCADGGEGHGAGEAGGDRGRGRVERRGEQGQQGPERHRRVRGVVRAFIDRSAWEPRDQCNVPRISDSLLLPIFACSNDWSTPVSRSWLLVRARRGGAHIGGRCSTTSSGGMRA